MNTRNRKKKGNQTKQMRCPYCGSPVVFSLMDKQDAYQWLADIISAPMSEAHIGHLGEYYCRQVIQESKKLLEARKGRRFQVIGGG